MKSDKWLKIYAFVTTTVILIATLLGVDQSNNQRFETITVERINVVEPDGKKEVVISNSQRMPNVVLEDGTVLRERGDGSGGAAGMLFYNFREEEAGGLTFSSLEGEHSDTGRPAYRASAGLRFDQYRQDQVVDVGYKDDGDTREAGLTVVDRPTDLTNDDMYELQKQIQSAEPEKRDSLLAEFEALKASGDLGGYRVFVGSDREENAIVNLFDDKSRVRLRMRVDSTGRAAIEFLDTEGNVSRTISASQ